MIRTGKQYIDGLGPDREIYIGGRLVRDVTSYAPFRSVIDSYAALYDLKHDPAHRDVLTYATGDGEERADVSFLLPQTPEDVVRRGDALRLFSNTSLGMLSRSPDIMNSQLAGIADNADWFRQWGDQWAENITNYYRYVRDNDLFLTHALGSPQTDRSKPSHQQKDPSMNVHVVRETDAGLIVSGAKQLATAAPLTDELLVWPNARGLVPGDEAYCVAFAIPVNSPGLKCFCREPLVTDVRNAYDHPISSRFEEIDALIVFDEVLVPWDRVFFYNNLEAATTMRFMAQGLALAHHSTAVQGVVRAGLTAALAYRIAETIQIGGFPNVGEKLGRLVAFLKTIEGLVYLAEHKPAKTPNGNWVPDRDAIQAYNVVFPEFNAEAYKMIRRLSGAGMMLTPSLADFTGPGAQVANRFFAGADTEGWERVQVFKLAWDLVGESVGQRVLLYDEFHSGDPMFFAANYARGADVAEWTSLLDGVLAGGADLYRSGRG
ncbi:4-hydroxyphenylacetate 3-hydroxylase family protein [Phytohabitans kaempferiae]|uniref:4-hydroxyphenylacetate 3-hydroxylase family protein n=1 Tax=Phytohabitans kaempferiae TaxID=1620943 RepID=A0ABV6M4X0_9ACTN